MLKRYRVYFITDEQAEAQFTQVEVSSKKKAVNAVKWMCNLHCMEFKKLVKVEVIGVVINKG